MGRGYSGEKGLLVLPVGKQMLSGAPSRKQTKPSPVRGPSSPNFLELFLSLRHVILRERKKVKEPFRTWIKSRSWGVVVKNRK